MSAKQYLKMADEFYEVKPRHVDDEVIRELSCGEESGNDWILEDAGYWMLTSKKHSEYAAHAINSHDELVAENERLRAALECATNNFPDAAEMAATEGWQLVPVEPTIEMVKAVTHSAVGFGTRAAYQAMLAAAPTHEGGAS